MENILEAVGGDGWYTGLLSEIILFLSDHNVAIQKVDGAFIIVDNIEKPSITIEGWDVQVLWAYQSTEWVPLSMIT